ncbi:TonB-dependent receptor [Undibacterium oligocarboniphilum]|uniref:TonB-dependent receptor n=1 Tax=Undibacterium oligocarboniphilum TaxID=666702 RepID=A0A850QSN0_9BURK|nr:TonB-dependent receptor [Undibacterium oligocarboniphilum]MBC3871595.1 TonB-dependent receptor [Undibacterium oligocarboniphilum]NVO79046.1 TonB-dependent receptor [Undibacterium oligocarboniphilum]
MKLRRLTVALAGIGLCSIAGTALGQDAISKEDAKKNDGVPVHKVEITGSNIKRVNIETASPIQIITKDEIVRSGATSLNDVLRTVSANIGGIDENRTNGFTAGAAGLNLRGIGSQATLVLINGRRLAPYAQPEYQTTFVDLNSVPIGAVERIEILKDGASAIYGSEAMAGVVNIILRNNFQGAEISGSYAQSQRSDGEQLRSTVSYGFGSLVEDHYNVYATLDVRQVKPMYINKRDGYLSTEDLRPYGYKDNRSIYTFPGNLYWTDKATGKFVTRTLDQNCPADRLVPAQTIFGANSMGTVCVFDDLKDSKYNSAGKTDRVGFTSRGTWQINATTEAFAEVMINQNKATVSGVPHWFAGQNGLDTPALPITHPQYPKDLINPVTGKTLAGGNGTVRVRASLNDFPGQGLENTTVFGRYLAGIKGTVANWDWESALMYNTSTVDSKASSGILKTPFINAYKNGTFLFGGSAQNADLLKQIVTDSSSNFKSALYLWDGKITGELMQLPAGPLSVAVGTEVRRETLEVNPSALAVAGELYHWAQSEPGYTRSRNIGSVYTELNAPLLKNVEASLAARYDKYSDYGSSTTPKLGLKWTVTPELVLRGTYATGFRAPTLVENSSQIKKAYLSYRDPARCNATFLAGCQWSSPYESGSNPDLKPETADSFTLGLVWEPTTWFDATVDFWQIKRKDEISTFDLATVLNNPGRYAGNPAAIVTRSPLTAADQAAGATAGEITNLRLLLTNIAQTQVRGVDVALHGKFNAGEYGRLTPSLQLTYNHSYKSAPAPDTEMIEYAGSRGQPRIIANLGLGWEKAAWKASVDAVHVGHMSAKDDFTQPCTFETQGYANLCGDIGSFTTFNVGGSYSGLYKNLKLSFAIRNIFDRMPPFAPSPTSAQAVAASSLHSTVGRYFMLTADYKFK